MPRSASRAAGDGRAHRVSGDAHAARRGQRGTATVRDLNLPLFGKTGTTTGPKDVWFVGGTQDDDRGAYVGFDQPRNLGGYGSRAAIPAAPIFKQFVERPSAKWRPSLRRKACAWCGSTGAAASGVRWLADRRSAKRGDLGSLQARYRTASQPAAGRYRCPARHACRRAGPYRPDRSGAGAGAQVRSTGTARCAGSTS
jgi:membrane peptidoglycan carboxypeptidase